MIVQPVLDRAAVELGATHDKPMRSNVAGLALAVRQEVEVGLQQLLEELGAPAPAVEHNGDPAFADELAHLVQDLGEHLDHTGVSCGGDHQERVTGLVVDPVVRGGGH